MTPQVKHFRLVQALGDEHIGLEARAQMDDHQETRIWLRLLACSTQIEHQIRQLLRVRFATSLPRFDYLAQLSRHPDGLRMNVLSRYLMVTGGNVTGLTDQLVKEGLVRRIVNPDDRRSWQVVLTAKGSTEFAAMAAEHERWLVQMFKGLPAESRDALYEHLGHLRVLLANCQIDPEEGQGASNDKAASGSSPANATSAAGKGAASVRKPGPARGKGATATSKLGAASGAQRAATAAATNADAAAPRRRTRKKATP